MSPSHFLSFWRALGTLLVIVGSCFLQWVLIGGINSLPGLSSTQAQREWPSPIITSHAPIQLGMVFPRWGQYVYSRYDPGWETGLIEMHRQTGAQWVEMVVNFYQPSLTSTVVTAPSSMAPSIPSFLDGIRIARALGYHVFVVPLLSVGGDQQWAGRIQFTEPEQETLWFDSYWQAVAPYVKAANQAGAEAFAIGTEYEHLQEASTSLWNKLIARFRQQFKGMLTYDMNWSSLDHPIPEWMHHPDLTTIGVSTYIALTDSSEPPAFASLPALWREEAKARLDAFAEQLGKHLVLSEVGFRDTADAVYQPWMRQTQAPVDPEVQAAAYNAVLINVLDDPHIAGIYFWAWSVPLFEPNNLPAAKVVQTWYTHATSILSTSVSKSK